MQVICDSEKSSNFIKNIFLASKALQTFLNKYDENQRHLKSEDSLQNNSTSSDTDDSSNTSWNEQNKEQKNLFGKNHHISISTLHPGTIVIYESTSTEAENISSLKNNNKATHKAHRLHIVSNQVNTDKDSDNNDSDEIQEIPIEISAKKHRIVHNKTINKNDKKVRNKRKKPKIFQNILGEKTRFSIQRFRSNTNKSDIVESKLAENARRIKKIIYSERFSPKNIWQEIISRPIQLIKDSDSDFRSVNFRSKKNDYIPYVIVTENKKVTIVL